MSAKNLLVGGVALCIVACGLPVGGAETGPGLELWSEDHRELDDVPPVARFRLRGFSGSPEDVWLVTGEVSSTSSRRMARRDPPTTIEQDRLPLSSWREGDELVLAPLALLAPGERHTFVALGVGELGRFVVSEEPQPTLRRLTTGAILPGGWVSYCAPTTVGDLGDVTKEAAAGPGFVAVEAARGFADSGLLLDRCVSFRAPSAPEFAFVLPPVSLGGALLEPAALPVALSARSDEPEEWCDAGRDLRACALARNAALEVPLPPGIIALSATPLRATGPRLDWVGVLEFTTVVALGPVVPGAEYELQAARLIAGQVVRSSTTLVAGEAEGRLVLTEVLSNPLGPEPASEWVEIYNAGTGPANLAGYRLHDAAGESVLPDVTLEPAQFGLIVGAGYRADPEVERVPAASAVPVVVAQLGQAGLLNGGETLSLYNPRGELVSKIPALEGAAGVSIVRLSPWLSDTASSFVRHGPPGVSPGTEGL